MEDLDYYALSRLFGAKMVPMKAPVFGHFGILEVTAEAAKVLHAPQKEKPRFTVSQEKLIVQTFEKIREGFPPEALQWNSEILRQFVKACRKAGLDFSQEDLVRRLQTIRKNPNKYARLGIKIKPATRKEHTEGVAVFAPVIEFALVRLRYRYGISIDEILIDRGLGAELEKLVQACVPELSPQQIRLAALSLRKKRFLPKNRKQSVQRLRSDRLEQTWSPLRPLATLDLSSIPRCGGIVELRQGSRDLYVSRNDDLHGVLEFLHNSKPLSLMASPFWTPNLNEIETRFIPETTLDPAKLEKWELKLLTERKPNFNWPISTRAA